MQNQNRGFAACKDSTASTSQIPMFAHPLLERCHALETTAGLKNHFSLRLPCFLCSPFIDAFVNCAFVWSASWWLNKKSAFLYHSGHISCHIYSILCFETANLYCVFAPVKDLGSCQVVFHPNPLGCPVLNLTNKKRISFLFTLYTLHFCPFYFVLWCLCI